LFAPDTLPFGFTCLPDIAPWGKPQRDLLLSPDFDPLIFVAPPKGVFKSPSEI